jgi:hypothetical protein
MDEKGWEQMKKTDLLWMDLDLFAYSTPAGNSKTTPRSLWVDSLWKNWYLPQDWDGVLRRF